MDLKTIKNLLKLIAESDVNEVELEEGNFKIRVKKRPDTIMREGSTPVYMSNPQPIEFHQPAGPATSTAASAPTPGPGASEFAPEPASTGDKQEDKYITVRSPIVGTFYRSPSPESEMFVNVGDNISKGSVLCIIEAMKIMNEIESEFSGKIVKILAENAQPVEFDQPLFLIDPS